jgi:hypothetical protein
MLLEEKSRVLKAKLMKSGRIKLAAPSSAATATSSSSSADGNDGRYLIYDDDEAWVNCVHPAKRLKPIAPGAETLALAISMRKSYFAEDMD